MNHIKELRLATGLSMRQTAELLGVPYTTYVNYEKGDREPPQRMLMALADHFGVTVDRLIGHTRATSSISTGMTREVPLLGAIACGSPLLAEENVEDYVPCPLRGGADFCLRCQGDSMIGARIHDGDLVYIKAQPTVENGQIAAVLIGDEATLKRVYLQGDTLILQPENPAYQPLILRGKSMEDVRVLGRAVGLCGRIN